MWVISPVGINMWQTSPSPPPTWLSVRPVTVWGKKQSRKTEGGEGELKPRGRGGGVERGVGDIVIGHTHIHILHILCLSVTHITVCVYHDTHMSPTTYTPTSLKRRPHTLDHLVTVTHTHTHTHTNTHIYTFLNHQVCVCVCVCVCAQDFT